MSDKWNNEDFQLLLQRLGLDQFYKKRITLGHIFEIDQLSIADKHQPITERDLVSNYLHKLIMLDYRARYITATYSNDNTPHPAKPSLEESIDDSAFDDFFNQTDTGMMQAEQKQTSVIHPMDLQMAILYCSDDFVRRYLFNKLATCQYAVPIIFPIPSSNKLQFNLWACRDIKIYVPTHASQANDTSGRISDDELTKTAINTKQQFTTCTAEQANIPVVSFMRIGNSTTSKSQLINLILNEKKHHTFFNRHCSGSSENCLLMNGIVEICWYCPGDTQEDVFNTTVAFTNLHGNVVDLSRQLELVNEMSNVNVLVMSESDKSIPGVKELLEKLFKSPKPLILLSTDLKFLASPPSGKNVKIAVKNRNEAEFRHELVSQIERMLHMPTTTNTLEGYVLTEVFKKQNIVTDEQYKYCAESKQHAIDVRNRLMAYKLSDIKSQLLPLQGKPWKRWCELDKSLHSLKDTTNKGIEQYRSDIETSKQAARTEQLKLANPLNPFVDMFIKRVSVSDNSMQMHFIKWIRQFIDDLFVKQLSDLQHAYHSKWSESMAAEGKKQKTEEQTKLKHISKEIEDNTFGIDHVFREIAQIYEASESDAKSVTLRETLVDLAARLLIQGYPLEFMDGDVAYVPMKWINAVLGRTQAKLGDVRVYVLSVLGLQSSGKSTMLNALFGLQFAVSAGRCTRGAFMQLVKVNENMSKELHFQYMLIVDTEGLRSTEIVNKDTLNHDNELATFVIGLANLTVINIFGENPSDMQDILQICVQAFLRMKQVNLHPSCIFVHQNVGDLNAGEKNCEARRCLQQKLDDMTKIAAEQEQCAVRRFNEVISFDINTQTRYFAHLWEGNPPMAPPNPVYSSQVKSLKRYILSECKASQHANASKLSDFIVRVNDLWGALRCENFVFNFKNSQEIAEYNNLETHFNEWAWELRRFYLESERCIKNEIKNNSDSNEAQIELNARQQLQIKYESITPKIADYFNEDNEEQIRIQWKAMIENKFRDLKEELICRCVANCQNVLRMHCSWRKLEEQVSECEKKLNDEGKALARNLKDRASNEQEITNAFNNWWSGEVEKVRKATPMQGDITVELDVKIRLEKRFESLSSVARRQSVEKYKGANFGAHKFVIDVSKHVEDRAKTNKYKNDPQIQVLLDSIKHIVEEFLRQKESDNTEYNAEFISEIIKNVDVQVDAFNKEHAKRDSYILTKQFNLDVASYMCMCSIQRFRAMHVKFCSDNSPYIHLQKKEQTFKKTFVMCCNGASEIEIFVELLTTGVSIAMFSSVLYQTCQDVADTMKTENLEFNQNRLNLESSVLRYLADFENFDQFMKYVNHPQTFFDEFISQRVKEFCDVPNRLQAIANKRLIEAGNVVENAIAKSCQEKYDKIELWVDKFVTELHNKVCLENKESYKEHKVTECGSYLQERMTSNLKDIITNLTAEIEDDMSLERLMNSGHNPQKILSTHFGGCWKQCPGCKAICTNTVNGHTEHSVPFHRPQAISGWHWRGTNTFVIDICTSLVASDLSFVLYPDTPDEKSFRWKNYKTAGGDYATWSIMADTSTLNYWQWFVCRFHQDLENYYSFKFENKGNIPDSWKRITKDMAKLSLKN